MVSWIILKQQKVIFGLYLWETHSCHPSDNSLYRSLAQCKAEKVECKVWGNGSQRLLQTVRGTLQWITGGKKKDKEHVKKIDFENTFDQENYIQSLNKSSPLLSVCCTGEFTDNSVFLLVNTGKKWH